MIRVTNWTATCTKLHQDLSYKVTTGDEVEDTFILLNEVTKQIPSVQAMTSGAIAYDYQRLRVESVCAWLGLVSLSYLWKQDQTFLFEEMRGVVAIAIKVTAMGLNPAKHLGKTLRSAIPSPSNARNARIVLDKFQVILHSPTFHLESKQEVPLTSSGGAINQDGLEKADRVCKVQGDSLQSCMAKCQSTDLASDSGSEEPSLCISTSKGTYFLLAVGFRALPKLWKVCRKIWLQR